MSTRACSNDWKDTGFWQHRRNTPTEFLFQPKRKKDSERGLYSSHEELGETVFYTRVEIAEQQGVTLKPGTVANVFFPFERLTTTNTPAATADATPVTTATAGEAE